MSERVGTPEDRFSHITAQGKVLCFQGLYISGILGDRFELRKVLAIGMCTSAVSVSMLLKIFEEYSRNQPSLS